MFARTLNAPLNFSEILIDKQNLEEVLVKEYKYPRAFTKSKILNK